MWFELPRFSKFLRRLIRGQQVKQLLRPNIYQIWFLAVFSSVLFLFTISPLLWQLQKYLFVNNLVRKIFVRFISIFSCNGIVCVGINRCWRRSRKSRYIFVVVKVCLFPFLLFKERSKLFNRESRSDNLTMKVVIVVLPGSEFAYWKSVRH